MQVQHKPRKSGLVKVAEAEARREERKAMRNSMRAARIIARRFAVMRIRKVKTVGAISNLSRHNLRNAAALPRNADPARVDQNRYFIREGCKTINGAAKARLIEAGIQPRKNAVMLVEMVCTFSPGARPKNLSKWANDTMQWARNTFGAPNVIAAEVHMDETTPHMHIQIVPIVSKQRKMRGKQEYHEAKERLDARHYTGGADRLSALQTSYAAAMAKHGLERGIMKSGHHNPRHEDVRFRRGKMIRERGILDVENRLEKAISERNTADRRARMHQNNYEAERVSRHTAQQELEEERQRFEREIARLEVLRLEALEKHSLAEKRLAEIDISRSSHKPQLRMHGPSGYGSNSGVSKGA